MAANRAHALDVSLLSRAAQKLASLHIEAFPPSFLCSLTAEGEWRVGELGLAVIFKFEQVVAVVNRHSQLDLDAELSGALSKH